MKTNTETDPKRCENGRKVGMMTETELTIKITERVDDCLENLVQSGCWGLTKEEAARRIIEQWFFNQVFSVGPDDEE